MLIFHRFLLYEVRSATSHEINALKNLKILHKEPIWKQTIKKVIHDIKKKKGSKTDNLLNTNLQVSTIKMNLFYVLIKMNLKFI